METILLGLSIVKVLQKWTCRSMTPSILLIWEIVCLLISSSTTASQKEILRFSLYFETLQHIHLNLLNKTFYFY